MTQKGFEKEIRYQAMLSICRAMLESGVISMDEFRSAERLLREKYQPIFCSLLIQFNLLCPGFRGNMPAAKEVSRVAKIIYQTMPGGRRKAGKKRVAAYARISCVKNAMLHSLSAQVSYFNDGIGLLS